MEIVTEGVFEITVICEECHTELPSRYRRGDLEVSRCPKCYSDERSDGYNEGFEDGKDSIEKEESV